MDPTAPSDPARPRRSKGGPRKSSAALYEAVSTRALAAPLAEATARLDGLFEVASRALTVDELRDLDHVGCCVFLLYAGNAGHRLQRGATQEERARAKQRRNVLKAARGLRRRCSHQRRSKDAEAKLRLLEAALSALAHAGHADYAAHWPQATLHAAAFCDGDGGGSGAEAQVLKLCRELGRRVAHLTPHKPPDEALAHAQLRVLSCRGAPPGTLQSLAAAIRAAKRSSETHQRRLGHHDNNLFFLLHIALFHGYKALASAAPRAAQEASAGAASELCKPLPKRHRRSRRRSSSPRRAPSSTSEATPSTPTHSSASTPTHAAAHAAASAPKRRRSSPPSPPATSSDLASRSHGAARDEAVNDVSSSSQQRSRDPRRSPQKLSRVAHLADAESPRSQRQLRNSPAASPRAGRHVVPKRHAAEESHRQEATSRPEQPSNATAMATKERSRSQDASPSRKAAPARSRAGVQNASPARPPLERRETPPPRPRAEAELHDSPPARPRTSPRLHAEPRLSSPAPSRATAARPGARSHEAAAPPGATGRETSRASADHEKREEAAPARPSPGARKTSPAPRDRPQAPRRGTAPVTEGGPVPSPASHARVERKAHTKPEAHHVEARSRGGRSSVPAKQS